MLFLFEGPAGAGKSQLVREMLADGEIHVQADLTAIWAAINGYERNPETGLYPVRRDNDRTIGLASYVKTAIVRRALADGLSVAVTTSSPDEVTKWQALADEAQTALSVRTIDPGREVVEENLADEDGELSEDCERAIGRWYGSRR